MDAIVQWFVAPLQYEFMVKAVIVSGFVGLVCAVLSCYMTLKGWALMGDAVSHSVTPGVVLAYIFNLPLRLEHLFLALVRCWQLASLNPRQESKKIQSLVWFLQAFLRWDWC